MPDSRRSGSRRPSRRAPRLSEEERKRLWHKAVMEKARQLKSLTDAVILVLLALVLLAHALPFVKGGRALRTYDGDRNELSDVIEQKRGYSILLDLLVPYGGDASALEEKDYYWSERLPEPPEIVWGVQPRVVYTHIPGRGELVMDRYGRRWEKRFRNVYPATAAAYLLPLVSFGAVALFVLYLLDRKIWMGRALPAASVVYGFGSVLYLMLTRVPTEGSWNAMRYGSVLAWYLLLIPLFLVGAASLLRFVVSQRWKRYVWAGLDIPEHLKPPEPEEVEEDAEAKPGRRRGRLASASVKKKPEEAEEEEGEEAEEAEEESDHGEEAEAPDDETEEETEEDAEDAEKDEDTAGDEDEDKDENEDDDE